MANNDSFIDEVSEEVRRDKLFALFRRYGWIAALLVVVLVGGAAWNEWRKASAKAEAEAFGNAVLEALDQDEASDRQAALAAIDVGDNPRAAAVLALLQASTDEDSSNVDALWAVSDDPSLPALWRDVAALKAAVASAGQMDPQSLIERLQPLALPGAPYRLLALEQIALAEISRGDTSAALDALTEIISDDAAGQGLRQRAGQLIVALGGDPEPA